MDHVEGSTTYESGLFSLGIADTGPKSGGPAVSTATRSNVMENVDGQVCHYRALSENQGNPASASCLGPFDAAWLDGTAKWKP